MPDCTKNFGDLCRTARKNVGLTLYGASLKLFVCERTILRYEAGLIKPDAEMMALMARVYKSPELLEGFCKVCPVYERRCVTCT